MLPSILSKQLEEGLRKYISGTYPMVNGPFKGSLQNFMNTEDAVYHEPYIAVRLPFRLSERKIEEWFDSIHTPFTPYVHQAKAFDRLNGEDGRSTLIATGTGSGKTECFLYPILEYCYRHKNESGIKALIIYPMNALATDQAKRIAGLIYDSPELHGNITAGLYVGDREEHPSVAMTEDQIITDHDVMLNNPPDILLTNYKMLDYLLVRPRDAVLWKENHPDTLKYIAVDELHTFDGAQGTDLACLIRRLKSRLYTQQGILCCIGTSATLGSKGSTDSIRSYAEKIFGEQFDENSVITEERISASEFFVDADAIDTRIPTDEEVNQLSQCIEKDEESEFLKKAASFWLTDFQGDLSTEKGRVSLSDALMHHSFFQAVIRFMGGNYHQVKEIVSELKPVYPDIASLHDSDTALNALFALVSNARTKQSGHLRPFLNVQVQLWIRELARLMGSVDYKNVLYAVANDLNAEQSRHYLPVVNCRNCGTTGWASVLNERQNAILLNPNGFYNKYFSGDPKIIFMYPGKEDSDNNNILPGLIDTRNLDVEFTDQYRQKAENSGYKKIPIGIAGKLNTSGRGSKRQFVCPFCGSKNGITILGVRSTMEISNSVSQMFASRFNDDKKTLAFSDNVQDAAHKAGFLNSRSWRFGLRIAIQQFIKAGGDGLNLKEFADKFLEYWHSRLSDEDYVGNFIAPNLTWMRAYEQLQKDRKLPSGNESKNLMDAIDKRLAYEIMLEYGLLSNDNRSLTQTECSTLAMDEEDIKHTAFSIKERAENEIENIGSFSELQYQQILLGYLDTMTRNGAFADQSFDQFVINNGVSYLLTNDKCIWMPGQTFDRYVPKFPMRQLGRSHRSETFDSIDDRKYLNWLSACLDHKGTDASDMPRMLIRIVFEEALKSSLVVKMPSPSDITVYGLNKEKVYVSSNTSVSRCSQCGTKKVIASDNAEIWENAPCSRVECRGRVHEDFTVTDNYFGSLYQTGDLFRINAREHTSLLNRDDREEIETEFKLDKSQRRDWDPNILSCTPTMEMGIDIGDLSTVILCDIPPAESSFLQRAGRAGRKDGNALTLVISQTKPHDSYFYADPSDMVNGLVEPPRVFLSASAVLERQFTAYCMDSWIRKGASEYAVPKKMAVCIQAVEKRDTSVFPYNFLEYVNDYSGSLVRSFLQMFPEEDVDKETRQEIRQFVSSRGASGLDMKTSFLRAFETIKNHMDAVQKNVDELGNLIKEYEKKPKDSSYEDEIKELNAERHALSSVIKDIKGKGVFEFLSDESLLPNYAFPEAGIVLKAILLRKSEDPEISKTAKTTYEYSRASSAAISEFAPMNTFYANGRRMQIDQVDLTTAQPAKWRLCPNCSHAELESKVENTASCPVCGSPLWADAGQVRNMLKVQMVYSTVDYRTSMIDDGSEERSKTFYNKKLLVDIDEANVVNAYEMDNNDFPFGFDYVKKATLREINFGKEEIDASTMQVAGEKSSSEGFKICRYCGRIQDLKGRKPKHTRYCRVSQHPEKYGDEAFSEAIFLYREFETEVLRMLIPSTSMDSSEVRTDSFAAAFMLGMKEHFGNVDHLNYTVSEFPLAESGERKKYLVVYDTVPGGTGYLKQLLENKDTLVTIFEQALKVLETCTCNQDPQKDGCYHCLYAYRSSRQIGNISRETAKQLLISILSGKDRIHKIKSLNDIEMNSLLESELERQFIEAIDSYCSENDDVTIEKAIVNGKEGYLLKSADRLWEVEPQVDLDQEEDVAVKSRPDFVFYPLGENKDLKPVAVFTDGFTYHKDIAADDTLKRMAIVRSEKFVVWSLSYEDVKNAMQAMSDHAADTLNPDAMPYGRIYYPSVTNNGRMKERIDTRKRTAFELLMDYLLVNGSQEEFKRHASAYALSLVQPELLNDKTALYSWHKDITNINNQLHEYNDDFAEGDALYGTWKPEKDSSQFYTLSGISMTRMKADRETPCTVFAVLEDRVSERSDRYQKAWNGFWHFFNVMQFDPMFAGVSAKGIEDHVYLNLPIPSDMQEIKSFELVKGWTAIKDEVFEEESSNFIQKASSLNIPAPDQVGVDLTDADEQVVGTLEFAWPKLKICYLTEEQCEKREQIEKMGWKVIDRNTVIAKDMWGA